MGAINSACEGCFGSTKDQYPVCSTTRQRRNEQPNSSGKRSLSSPGKDESMISTNPNEDHPDQTKTVKRFSFTSKEFELVRILVKGAFGKVFLVRRKSDNQFLVLKVLKRRDIGVKNLLSCTIAENSLIKDIEHPFILRLQDSYHDHARAYLLIEYCPGGNLIQRIKKDRKFDLNTAKIYAAELILAIQYIHENLNMIHRDLNPENILLASDSHLRITDFGFSKTQVKGINSYGTPDYRAPEIAAGHVHGPEVDWWSLGCILYFMLAGKHLFEHQNRGRQLVEDSVKHEQQLKLPIWFSTPLKDLLTGLLKRKPKERLGTKGAQQVKSHPFFKDLDWDAVLNKGLKPSVKVHTIEEEVAEYEKSLAQKSSLKTQGESSPESFALTHGSDTKVSLNDTQDSICHQVK